MGSLSSPLRWGALTRLALRAFAAVLLWASPAATQSTSPWAFGGAGTGSLWLVAGDVFEGTLGVDATVWRSVGMRGSVRADVMLMPVASNRTFVLAVGPELDAGLGPVALYGRVLAGIAINQRTRATSSPTGRTTRSLALGGGAGIRLAGSGRVALDVGGDIVRVGELTFAREAASAPALIGDSGVLRLRAGVRIAP